jgi:hypothetical protein
MGHEILGERFAKRNGPAWHGLGRTFDGNVTPSEGVKLAGANFEVSKRPLLWMGENGELVSAADQFAIVRGPLPEHDDSQKTI